MHNGRTGAKALTIAPIRHAISVPVPPARAFAVFTARMGAWWPRGRTIGAAPHADIVLQPHEGGAWFERDDEGRETRWGAVLVWQPPHRLVLSWQIGADFKHDPHCASEVEITFTAHGGGTEIVLEHRNLHLLGADAARIAEKLNNGWPGMLAAYAAFAETIKEQAHP